MYLIKRTDQRGGFLGANPGVTGQTWVRDVRKARIFRTYSGADAERCVENEIVVPLENVLEGLDRW